MTLYNHATPEASETSDAVLDVLARAAAGRAVAAQHRVVATPDRFNPDEGLALLDAYVGIADTSVRQAILDIVLAITGANPYARQSTEDPACDRLSRKDR